MTGSCLWEPEGLADIRERLRGTNINRETLLATDYLNHFNEVVMLLEMLPEMPDCLDEVAAWSPQSYEDHFRGSGFTDRELAIEAFAHSPERYRAAFGEVIALLDSALLAAIGAARAAVAAGDDVRLRTATEEALPEIRRLQDAAGSVINGTVATLDQSAVDALFG